MNQENMHEECSLNSKKPEDSKTTTVPAPAHANKGESRPSLQTRPTEETEQTPTTVQMNKLSLQACGWKCMTFFSTLVALVAIVAMLVISLKKVYCDMLSDGGPLTLVASIHDKSSSKDCERKTNWQDGQN